MYFRGWVLLVEIFWSGVGVWPFTKRPVTNCNLRTGADPIRKPMWLCTSASYN
jgi:hypothetical protein